MVMTSVQHQANILPHDLGRVGVLLGGASSERDISLKSGSAVLAALRARGVDAIAFDPAECSLTDLTQARFDRVFIALHGRGGEDGVMQGVLEMAGIPYTGCGVLASALAMDKLRTKQLLRGAGLESPEFWLLQNESDCARLQHVLPYPLAVKPACEGSSIGISKVTDASQLMAAWALAAQRAGAVFAERWVQGDEFTVAILGDEALPVIRVETPRGFYDYQAKYFSNDTLYHCPCGLAAEAEHDMHVVARAAFAVIGGRGWGRVDFMRDSQGKPWIIEINTVPGLTDHSLVPMAARAAGIAFDELIWRILLTTTEPRG
jgi:D-alanine-D-alanine ligase